MSTKISDDTLAAPDTTDPVWDDIEKDATAPVEFGKCDDGNYTVTILGVEFIESPQTGNPSFRVQCAITGSDVKDNKGQDRYVNFRHTQYFPLTAKAPEIQRMIRQRCAANFLALGYSGPMRQLMGYASKLVGVEADATFITNASGFQNCTFKNTLPDITTRDMDDTSE